MCFFPPRRNCIDTGECSAAMAVSLGTMDYTSGGVIAALVILNVATGTSNEWKAEKVCSFLLYDRLYV